MRNPSLCLLGMLPLLLPVACMHAVELQYEVNADGSGRVTATRCLVPETSPAGDVFQGLGMTAALTLESATGSFANLSDVDVGGIRASLEPAGAEFLFTLTIPLGKDVEWVEALGLTAADTRRLVALDERMNERSEGRTFKPSFGFKVALPGTVRDSRLRGRELPQGWRLDRQVRFAPRESLLTIPFEAIEDLPATVVWEVRCGPPEQRDKGARSKHSLDRSSRP